MDIPLLVGQTLWRLWLVMSMTINTSSDTKTSMSTVTSVSASHLSLYSCSRGSFKGDQGGPGPPFTFHSTLVPGQFLGVPWRAAAPNLSLTFSTSHKCSVAFAGVDINLTVVTNFITIYLCDSKILWFNDQCTQSVLDRQLSAEFSTNQKLIQCPGLWL